MQILCLLTIYINVQLVLEKSVKTFGLKNF